MLSLNDSRKYMDVRLSDINLKLKQLKEKHILSIKSLRDEINEVQQQLEQIPDNQRWRIQEKLGYNKRIVCLQKRIKILERAYQNKLSDAMEMITSRQDQTGGVQTRPVVSQLDPHPEPVACECLKKYTKCTFCGQLLEKMMDASVMICPKCGVAQPYVESTRDGLAFDEDIEFLNNTYKQSNHLQEHLNHVQGRETSPIPWSVIHQIKRELYRAGLRSTSQITPGKLRDAMKHLKLRDYYKNTTSILAQLTGRKPKRLLNNEELEIVQMFVIVQKLFEKHRPEGRRNMLSYSYVGYKCCEIKKLNWMCPCFKLLKGDDKLHKQDEIWQKICNDTGWPFIPSI